jgi:hypothetical protein
VQEELGGLVQLAGCAHRSHCITAGEFPPKPMPCTPAHHPGHTLYTSHALHPRPASLVACSVEVPVSAHVL